jgi:hypothetical protein
MLLVAFAPTTARTDDAIIEDDDETNAAITSVTLVWHPNPKREDIAGYNVYYGVKSGNYSRLVSVTDPNATIGVKSGRTFYFAVTAFNTSGAESELSAEVHWP